MAIYIKSDGGGEAEQTKPVPTKPAPAKPAPTETTTPDTTSVQHVRGTQVAPTQQNIRVQTRRGHENAEAAKPAQPQKVQQPGNEDSRAVQDKIRRNAAPRHDAPSDKAKTEDKAKTDRKAKIDPKQEAKPGTNPLPEKSKDKENKQNNKI